MKKIICFVMLLAILMSSVIWVYAADSMVVFTSKSKFEVGGTATVDFLKTSEKVMNDPNVMADMYNAALEQDMDVVWRCSNGPDKEGKSVTWTAEDAGKEYVCRVGFYADDALTELVDYIDSDPFVIAGGTAPTILTISTQNLEIGKVGIEYYQKLKCSDPNVNWSLFRSSLPDGLSLTKKGEIKGTPTKAGDYYVVIMATPKTGEEYAATAEFELSIAKEDEQLYTMEIQQLPKKLEYTAGEKLDMKGLKVRIYGPDGYLDSVNGENLTYSNKALTTLGEQKIALQYKDAFEIFIVTVKAAPGAETESTTAPTVETIGDPTEAVTEPEEETEASEPAETSVKKGQKKKETGKEATTNEEGGDIWVFVAIGLGVLIVGMGVAIVVVLKKKKA